MKPIALTIAGSDPSGGAGIQADLKTFYRFGVHGRSVISLITAQNSEGIQAIRVLGSKIFRDQLRSVLSDMPPKAAKIGALGNASLTRVLIDESSAFQFPIIIDPIFVGTKGTALLETDAIEIFKKDLLPSAYLVTPNISEAEVLTGLEIKSLDGVHEAAKKLSEFGVKNVLIKGGHLNNAQATDVFYDGKTFHEFAMPRIETKNTHGTGCTYSAAITAFIAKGESLLDSIKSAKAYVHKAIEKNHEIGSGYGPINHHVSCESN